MPLASNGASPCAACKLLRRRCAPECVFAPHFPAEQPHKFAIVHRVFGASNTNKMLQDLPPDHRADAVSSLVYEAEARFRDPVYGCVGAIASLQQQVAELQAQLAQAQAETVYARLQQVPPTVLGNSLPRGADLPVLPLTDFEALPLQLALESPGFRKEKQVQPDLRNYHSYANDARVDAGALMCVQEAAPAAPPQCSDMQHSMDTKGNMLHPISLNMARNNFMLPQDASPFSVMDFGDMDSFNSINQMSPPTPPGSPELLSPYSRPMFPSFALGSFW